MSNLRHLGSKFVATGQRNVIVLLLLAGSWLSPLNAQVSGTGVLLGSVVDPTGAKVAGARITVTSETTSFTRTLTSNRLGLYVVALLPPDRYTVAVEGEGFARQVTPHIQVAVAGSQTVDLHLSTVAAVQQLVVAGNTPVEPTTDSSAAGSVTSHQLVTNLPLASRNFTQIIGLNPGVATDIANAGAVGRGDTSYIGGPTGFSSNGAATNDNNFQMNGVDVNDIQASAYVSRGIPIPNPDAIEEFRVSTQPYNASFGRNAGANVNLVTRSGTERLHGSAFEYFRNNVLNANSYFRKATQQRRAALQQNQFGGSLSGPIVSRKLLGFGSYQETRQSNGLDATCSGSAFLPPLTNDRSAAGIGEVFAGQRGYFQDAFGGVGPAIAANGSNVNPVALAVLQQKNPDGTFLIPTPQLIVSTSGNFDARGLSTFSSPCPYTEHQGVADADWQPTQRSSVALRTFVADSSETQTLPASLLGGSELPGSPFHYSDRFRSASITHTYVLRANLLNQFEFGFNRVRGRLIQGYPFTFSGIGASVPTFANAQPAFHIANVSLGGQGQSFSGAENTFVVQDTVAYVHGRNFLHFGGDISRAQDNQPLVTLFGAALFLSFPDFVLGQNALQNGTASVCAFVGCGSGYSDIAFAQENAGHIQREYRVLSGNAYVQDDLRLTSRLTVNLGLRYERLGDFADRLGHNVSFFPGLANLNPPATGSLQGFVVPANYQGTVPEGVTRLGNNYGIDGDGQNTWQPRAAAAWRLPGSAIVLHLGYGLFRSRLTGDPYSQSITSPPFAQVRQFEGTDAASASLTLQQPLPPFTETLPAFTPYCPPTSQACGSSAQAYVTLAPNDEPPVYQHYNLDIDTTVTHDLSFTVGYVGSRGTHLVREINPDQASLASPTNPINGVTTNTLANLPFRVPLPGFETNNLSQIQTSGANWYNAMQATLHKQASRSGELLVSYTWARLLEDSYGGVTAQHGGILLGNQLNSRSTYGPDNFLRPQRLVVSYLLALPAPAGARLHALLAGWKVSGVVAAQSGDRLTVTYQNQFSAYGVLNDRAQLVPGCSPVLHGSAEDRLSAFFNTKCFTTPPVIGNDGIATGFGNAPVGNLVGPHQVNVDAALVRAFSLDRLHTGTSVDLRAEAYNLFNHPQFSNPDTGLSDATFGQISTTAVNPRIVQIALNLRF